MQFGINNKYQQAPKQLTGKTGQKASKSTEWEKEEQEAVIYIVYTSNYR